MQLNGKERNQKGLELRTRTDGGAAGSWDCIDLSLSGGALCWINEQDVFEIPGATQGAGLFVAP